MSDDIKYFQVLVTKDGIRSEMMPIMPSEYRPRVHKAIRNHKKQYEYCDEAGNLQAFTTVDQRTYSERKRTRAIIVEMWED